MDSFTVFGFSFSWLDAFVLLCTLGYGAYAVYTGICLKSKQCFFKNGLLVPKGRTAEACIAPEQYFGFLIPRLIVVGLLPIVLGIFNFIWPVLVVQYALPYLLGLAGIIPILAVLVLFNLRLNRAYREFWP